MEIITNKTTIECPKKIFPVFEMEKALFFDIETTGFSSKSTKIYLIGCLYYNKEDNCFESKQFFADDFSDEAVMLSDFFEFLSSFKYIVHFNGQGFDIPYIEAKCIFYNLDYSFSSYTSIDLYKLVSPLKKILKLENVKQKIVETFMEVNRYDKFSGKELINIYLEYIKTKDETQKSFLLLHNYEDICGMIKILPILNYLPLFNNEFEVTNIAFNKDSNQQEKEVIIECSMTYEVPKRISYGDNVFYFTAYKDTLKIRVPIYLGGLKYFYPNYKDYYYLPKEDYSIHKSVAFYVDKNFKTKAKAANCYSKKTGRFLPQIHEIVSPYFKINYEDTTTYFELTTNVIDDKNILKQYINDILIYLKTSKGW